MCHRFGIDFRLRLYWYGNALSENIDEGSLPEIAYDGLI